MLIEDALELVKEMTAEDLSSLSRDDLMYIVNGMNEQGRSRFFMEKNVKVFGGIDAYVNDFLNKLKLSSMNEQGKGGVKAMLNKMLLYPGINESSKKRIQDTLTMLTYAVAPAAGGKSKAVTKRKAITKTRGKKKGLKRSRVRR